jgi:acetylornithine deacetylase
MHRVMGEILQWRSELQSRYRNPLFEVEVPTLNLGHIHGGDNPNRICGHCELQIDLRPLPGMELEALRGELTERLGALLADSELRLEMVSSFSGVPAMETPASAAIVRASEEFTGHPAEAVAFGTEGPYLQQLGADPIILGAGDIDQAHQPDEYLALDRIQPMIELIRSLVARFCL